MTRAGLRALKINIRVLVPDQPHRTWRSIRDLLASADLPTPVRDSASAVFARLAEAEAKVHDVPAETVHFHEVGALDSIADVVGVCAAFRGDRGDDRQCRCGVSRVRRHVVEPR